MANHSFPHNMARLSRKSYCEQYDCMQAYIHWRKALQEMRVIGVLCHQYQPTKTLFSSLTFLMDRCGYRPLPQIC